MLADGLYAYLVADAGMQTVLGLPNQRSDNKTGIYAMAATGIPAMPHVVYYSVGNTNRPRWCAIRAWRHRISVKHRAPP